MNEINFELPTTDELDYINTELARFSRKQLPLTTGRTVSLNRVIKVDNQVVAGIKAQAQWQEILKISVLWVHADYRGRDYATALIQEVEQEAIRLGCHVSQLSTFEFQARGFYEKMGYQVFGIIENALQGHDRYFLSKRLKKEILL